MDDQATPQWIWRHHRPIEGWRNWVTGAALFLSSYAVLFGILGVQLWGNHLLSLAAFGLCFFGVVALAAMLAWAHRGSPDPYRVVRVEDRGADIAGYVVGYLLPLLVEDPSGRQVFAMIAFIAVVGIIYVRSDLVAINPLLYLFRYRVMTVTLDNGQSRVLIARRIPGGTTTVLAHELFGPMLVRASVDDRKGAE